MIGALVRAVNNLTPSIIILDMCNDMIYLASQSPRRKLLLEQIKVLFKKLPSEIDEIPFNKELPKDYVLRMAIEKAKSGWAKVEKENLPVYPVLAADTSVVANNEILGKPADRDHAFDMLTKLRGRSHQVMTAVALTNGKKYETSLSITFVKMAQVSDEKIKSYIATGESMDKAGGYAIQGMGAILIERIEGSYSGAVGLPLYSTAKLLEEFGISVWQRNSSELIQ
ncbi:MAG: Maf family protein [Candidatus Endonucleobacter sp. (ex Gigantidas childressi)]|nr:Maf family protein [Candidatus Endonucleobacter sp. (ex Gigantidas childressi)]